MYQSEAEAISAAAVAKTTLARTNKFGYALQSMLAGVYIGMGTLAMVLSGSLLPAADHPMSRFVGAAVFVVALSMVLMAGAELFTGNVLVMGIGALRRGSSWADLGLVWIFSWIGNLVGSAFLAVCYIATGALNTAQQTALATAVQAKVGYGVGQLFVRGMLCNFLVCVAVWCGFKLKNEVAKLIMVFWCIFTFVALGFEHSVANMTWMALGIFAPNHPINLIQASYNLLWVTLGNIAGAVIFVVLPYWASLPASLRHVSHDKQSVQNPS